MGIMATTKELLLHEAPPAVSAGRAVLDADPATFAAWLAERGQTPLRWKQIRRWLLAGRVESFAGMTDLPASLRTELVADWSPFGTTIARRVRSLDGTFKLLLRLYDGGMIECVLIPERDRRTACISTQVGCGMGCVFCASGLDGVARNLSTGEILEQLIRLRNLQPAEERLTNIVVMGMGEPLANLDNLLAALAVAGDKDGLNIGQRHVTISTVGLPAKIRRLADEHKRYHLAVSLHAPNDELRNRVVPTNPKTGLADILAAADYYYATTGRQVTYEYVLLGGLNDGPVEARQLADLLSGRQAHVNLIPFNDVPSLPYRGPTAEARQMFVDILRRARISVKVRKRKGADIDAACGQLRRTVEIESIAGRRS
jgi:23S rRNA (adenine2503-C2)-methyltransferase